VSLAISVAVPVLLGAYLRAHRDLSDAYRARALAAEQSRMAAEARARADERVALARELHDLVAHHMSSIVLRIRVARSVVDAADPRLRAAMDDIADTSAGVLADIRALLAALRDDPTVVSALGESTKLEAEITAAVERVRAVGFSVLDSIDPDLDGINAVSRLTLLRVVQESLTNVMKYGDRHQDVSAAPAATSAVDSPSLTPREREVLALVAEGLSNQEIAERLHLGVTTVKTHVANLMDKTSSANRVRLAVFAVRDGHTP
jgi:DNA-binding CsgD family transcriptional regulator/signal transduction histidine kinase